ncbi:MAG: hypothetical protein IJ080_01885 [Oscillospiraceae bacterium]|nr:hypothetical protein [Oscillospiraceae bacterium]MBQ8978493.1 hypothetical protein [Oscillospiraceae bacterium]
MKKRCILMLLLCLTMTAPLAGCDSSRGNTLSSVSDADKSGLIGTWKGTGNEISTITFNSDGTYRDDAGSAVIAGPYEVDTQAMTVTVTDEEYGLVFRYSYTVSGDDLTLQMEGGLPRTFRKQ